MIDEEVEEIIKGEADRDLILQVAQIVAECNNLCYRGFIEVPYIEAAKKIITLVRNDKPLDVRF